MPIVLGQMDRNGGRKMKRLEKRKAIDALSFQVILTKNDFAHLNDKQVDLLSDSLSDAVDVVLNDYKINTK
jgi:hypothetical protein